MPTAYSMSRHAIRQPGASRRSRFPALAACPRRRSSAWCARPNCTQRRIGDARKRLRRATVPIAWRTRRSGHCKMLVTGSRRACAARWRTRSSPCALRLRAAILRVCAPQPMTWSARCSALARRSTVNLVQPRALEQPARHPVVNLGPSRESTAKSSQLPPPIKEWKVPVQRERWAGGERLTALGPQEFKQAPPVARVGQYFGETNISEAGMDLLAVQAQLNSNPAQEQP